jgi:hypothetical protein
MTERETLLAEIAEKQARLAEIDAEPDYEAWRPVLQAYYMRDGKKDLTCDPLDESDKVNIRGLIAAFAKAPPMGSVMPEAEIEALADSLGPFKFNVTKHEDYSGEHREWSEEYTLPVGAALTRQIVAATLSRVQPRWPSEEGKVKLVIAIINAYHTTRLADTPVAQHILSKAFVKDAFDRAYKTEDQP